MFQTHYQTIRPTTTAHLAQTMTLLSLTADALRQEIDSELAANPALELVEERRCPLCHRLLPPTGSCPVCSQPKDNSSEEPVVFVSPREDFYTGASGTAEEMPEDQFAAGAEDLPSYVLRQVAPELNPEDRRLAAYLLTHLDEDGLLTIELIEIARYFHIPLSRIEAIQAVIQRADPVGVGSTSCKEALLVQLDVLKETGSVPEFAEAVIRNGMDLLSHRQYPELARMLHASLRQTQEAARFISENLNPFPARSHWGDGRQNSDDNPQVFHRPDILINYLNDDPNNPLVVEIIMPIGGTLRVNPLFREALHEAKEDKRDEWRNDLDRASLFVKCLQQRNHTMIRLMQRVVSLQKEYILHGEKFIKPVTRARLSVELEVHESTISRAVSSKAVQLPNGRIVPLSSFFDRNLNVRTILRDIISEEKQPLSDTELAEKLAQQGIVVARRTVAKYRAMEGILPAHLRRSSLQVT